MFEMFKRLNGFTLSFLDSKGEPVHIINSSNVTDEPLLKMLLTKVLSFISGILQYMKLCDSLILNISIFSPKCFNSKTGWL